MKKKLLCFLAVLIAGIELNATDFTDDFVSYGNVASQGIGSSAGVYTNVTEYEPGKPISTTGYLLVGGRYKIQHLGIAAGWHTINTGILDFLITDTLTGLRTSLSQQCNTSHSTAAGAIWTARRGVNNCVEILTPWGGSTVLGYQYDFDSYFDFQITEGQNSPRNLGYTEYTTVGGANGDIIGLINIGNITNNLGSEFTNTDLVAVVANNPSNANAVNIYCLNYNDKMSGPVSSPQFGETLNAISGAGTVAADGTFGALIGFGGQGSGFCLLWLPVTGSGEGFGGAGIAQLYINNCAAPIIYREGHVILRPIWNWLNPDTIAQTWHYVNDTQIYNDNWNFNFPSSPQPFTNMGWVLRSGDNGTTQQIFGDNYSSVTTTSNATTNTPDGLNNLMATGIIIGIPPGYYGQVSNSSVTYKNTLSISVSSTNTYSTSNNINVSLSGSCKYGSVGASIGSTDSNTNTITNTFSTNYSESANINSTNNLTVYGTHPSEMISRIWFIGAMGAAANGIHYYGCPNYGSKAFPSTTILNVDTNYWTINYSTVKNVDFLKGMDFLPNNFLTTEGEINTEAWANYYSKMQQFFNCVNIGGISHIAHGDGFMQQPTSGSTNISINVDNQSSVSKTKEHGLTTGLNASIAYKGASLGLTDTNTKTHTVSSTWTTSNSFTGSITYGAMPEKLDLEYAPEVNPLLYFVDVAAFKLASMRVNGSMEQPWFISDFMWNNNRNFWILVYDVNQQSNNISPANSSNPYQQQEQEQFINASSASTAGSNPSIITNGTTPDSVSSMPKGEAAAINAAEKATAEAETTAF